MAAPAEENTELTDLQARVSEIATLLRNRAPKLAPSVTPRPMKAFTSAVGLCATVKQRLSVEAFCVSKAAELAAEREQQGGEEEKGEGDEDHVVVETQCDVATRTFRITEAKFAGKIDATLHNLERLMELHLTSTEQELEPYVRRFADANELGSDASAASALHDVCSLAYALQVAASNMPGWVGYAGSFRLPLAEDVDATEVMRELFEPPPPRLATPPKSPTSQKKGKKGGASSSKKKAKKRKPKGEGEGVAKKVAVAAGKKEREGAPKEGKKRAKGSSKGTKRKKP